jgi:hypothetical protein
MRHLQVVEKYLFHQLQVSSSACSSKYCYSLRVRYRCITGSIGTTISAAATVTAAVGVIYTTHSTQAIATSVSKR